MRLVPIAKAEWSLEPMQSRKVPAKSDRQRVSAYQTLHIRWRLMLPQSDEVVANFHSHGEVDLIHMLGVVSGNDYVCGNNSAEVEQNQPRPDFLFDIDYFF